MYSPQFKREQLARVERGELTLAELSREIGISRSLLQRWKALALQATETAVAPNDDGAGESAASGPRADPGVGAGTGAQDDGGGDPPHRSGRGQKVVVRVAFVLDCHDRECLAVVAVPRALTSADVRQLLRDAVHTRFGAARAPVPCEWLTDNGAVFTVLPTVLVAEHLGLVPITTPIASPESNGMAEAFVPTDDLDGADLTATAVPQALPGWIADYNTEAPHSSLHMLSPVAWRRAQMQATP